MGKIKPNSDKGKVCRSTKELLIIGCNYHTTWQNHPSMRFVLGGIKKGIATLYTRTTKKVLKCKANELLFIKTNCNINKASIITGKSFIKIKDYIDNN